MNKITSPECLQNCIDKYSAEFEAKIKGTNGKRAVVVCGGTGCLANASADIIEELKRLVKEKGLEDKVSVNHVGCFGFCSQGPFVKIFPEDTLYRAVKVSDVKQIVEDDLIGGKICENLLKLNVMKFLTEKFMT